MERLLITGGSGFLGGNLAAIATSCWETYVTYHSTPILKRRFGVALHLDIRNKDEVESILCELSPKVVIHAAALTDLDYCAEHQKAAWEINVRGTENVALAAEHVKARLIYVSTDSVFKGDEGLYSEDDLPEPLGYYGQTKLEGERIVSSLSSNYCIARASLLYGWSLNSSRCFTETMINDLRNKREVKLFVDEYRTPMYVKNLCEMFLELAARDELQGIFHIGGSQRLSRFEFGLRIAQEFGFNEKYINPVSVKTFPFVDKRPRDCSMRNEKAASILKAKFWSIEQGLKDMKQCLMT